MIDKALTEERQANINLKHAWLALAISVCAILALGEFSSIDLLIEDYYYDPVLKTFPWKNTWFAKELMHTYLKNLILVLGYCLYLFLLIDLLKPWRMISSGTKFRLQFVAAASIFIPLTISLLKKYSSLHCPWDVDRYHGTAPFLKLLDEVPYGLAHGACFPAGHASTGLWLASLCIFWLPNNPKKASYVFMLGLGFGFTLGWVQQMRGAHFLFHTLWSMWITSLITLLMLHASKASITND